MKLYKLVDKDYTTYNQSMSWEIGKINSVPKKENPRLCTSGVIHAYRDLNIGLFLNSIHANIDNPIILECEGDIVVEEWDKVGVFEITPLKKIPYPEWYKDKIIRRKIMLEFAIVCAESVLDVFESKYPNDKRPRLAIEAAKKVLKHDTQGNRQLAAADAASYASYDADDAARAASYAARAAAHAAAHANAAYYFAAYAAAYVAYDAAYAAYAVRSTAYVIKIDFIEILNDIIKKHEKAGTN